VRASEVARKFHEMGVNTPVYVAGLERGVRPDRALIDVDDAIDMFHALHAIAGRGIDAAVVELTRDMLQQRVVHQRRLTRTRHAGDAGHDADGNVDANAAQVIAARIHDPQCAIFLNGCAFCGNGNRAPARIGIGR